MERLVFISKHPLFMIKIGIVAMAILLLSGCSHHRPVPVKDTWGAIPQFHQVKSGETLYAIAWHYGRDYRDLARLNNISQPYKIMVGQKLKLANKSIIKNQLKKRAVAPQTRQQFPLFSSSKPTFEDNLPNAAIPAFIWPVEGRVIAGYAARGGMNKGIDIVAKPGALVKATAAGRIVYSGSGLRGYGELIIIKHNDVFLSAYAHNKKLFVREGDKVAAGKVIAQVGDSDAKRVLLHFEIRQAGKPVDPLKYLPSIH